MGSGGHGPNGSGLKTLTTTLSASARHQQNVMIRTPEPARRSLTLSSTRSPKSLASLTGNSSTMTSTIHECDEGLIRNNSDDEDEDSLSSMFRKKKQIDFVLS